MPIVTDLLPVSNTSAPDFAAIAQSFGFPYLHQRADSSWEVPSDSTPYASYTVWLTCANDPTCTCEAYRWNGRCYHIDIARARGQQSTPPPAAPSSRPIPAPVPGTDHRYIALRDELYGSWAA